MNIGAGAAAKASGISAKMIPVRAARPSSPSSGTGRKAGFSQGGFDGCLRRH